MRFHEGTMTICREDLITNLEKARVRLCSYVNSENFCDCKFGVEGGFSEGTGCPEVRTAMSILEAMTDDQYGMLVQRIENYGFHTDKPTQGDVIRKDSIEERE